MSNQSIPLVILVLSGTLLLLRSMLCLMPLASCSILFSPRSESLAIDAGGSDAPEPDAKSAVEYSYEFEDGLPLVWENQGCTVAVDPIDAMNQVICCETIENGSASFSLSLDGLGLAPRKHAEVEFRVLSVVGPQSIIATAHSPLAAANDGQPGVVVVNMNMYPDNSIAIVSFDAGAISEKSGPDAFTTNVWSQAKMIASTDEGCLLSAEINTSKSQEIQRKNPRGDFEELIFGIFRQQNTITNSVRRCFDDIAIRFPTECTVTN